VEKIGIVFGCLFEPGVDGCELNQGHHGHLVNDDDDVCRIKAFKGQVELLKGIKGILDREFELLVYGVGVG
jgi:hypothetical protein